MAISIPGVFCYQNFEKQCKIKVSSFLFFFWFVFFTKVCIKVFFCSVGLMTWSYLVPRRVMKWNIRLFSPQKH